MLFKDETHPKLCPFIRSVGDDNSCASACPPEPEEAEEEGLEALQTQSPFHGFPSLNVTPEETDANSDLNSDSGDSLIEEEEEEEEEEEDDVDDGDHSELKNAIDVETASEDDAMSRYRQLTNQLD